MQPLEDVFAEQRSNLRSARAALARFGELYTEAQRSEMPGATLLTGAALISRTLEATVNNVHHEVMTAQPGGGRPPDVLEEAIARDLRMLARGVRQRSIYQHTIRLHQPTLAYVDATTRAGAEVRTLAEVFERLIVLDREVAYIPVSDQRADAALEIRHPGMVRFICLFFESAWSRSLPVHGESRPRPPRVTQEVQQAILRAVVSGDTDDSIARRLGMSRRSVSEHIRKVSQQLGSSSRAQLGYLLATSGWRWDGQDPQSAPETTQSTQETTDGP
ncbi:LuxR C-terminal-related transcriptional regulator [Streptomyces sp. NBC_00690]|uniref:LuxR C-terminal-related transcriptional regulator n=1 Tax=Streptomyces sp. NBC_00690 TaxID=2975808 RepID=UPI002E2B6CAB|nr:LuxR C-terminal-related transcriptional regulator [Streptomyces sp. NBC_00690]